MSSIYTKTGDMGDTSLYGGSRISKNSKRVWAYGTLDEAISFLGISYSFCKDNRVRKIINSIQHELFTVGAELASDKRGIKNLSNKIDINNIKNIENYIDEFSKDICETKKFIVPGVNKSSSFLHGARTIMRRAERCMIDLKEKYEIRDEVIAYTNRLSDLLYIMARVEESKYIMDQVKYKIINTLGSEHKPSRYKKINKLNLGRMLSETAICKAEKLGIPIVFSMVDEHGNIVILERMENSLLASIDISVNKAFSSSALKISTDKIGELCKEKDELYGIQWTNKNKIVPFGGGYPLILDKQCIGGIGISGGTVQEDMIIGSHVMRMFQLEN